MGLKFWANKKNWDKPFPEKVANRVAKLPTADIPLWMEQALSETNRSLSSYLKSNDFIYAEELVVGAEALNALASELARRTML